MGKCPRSATKLLHFFLKSQNRSVFHCQRTSVLIAAFSYVCYVLGTEYVNVAHENKSRDVISVRSELGIYMWDYIQFLVSRCSQPNGRDRKGTGHLNIGP